jgi:hypothetical protein
MKIKDDKYHFITIDDEININGKYILSTSKYHIFKNENENILIPADQIMEIVYLLESDSL